MELVMGYVVVQSLTGMAVHGFDRLQPLCCSGRLC